MNTNITNPTISSNDSKPYNHLPPTHRYYRKTRILCSSIQIFRIKCGCRECIYNICASMFLIYWTSSDFYIIITFFTKRYEMR